jgi:hypothetical protein
MHHVAADCDMLFRERLLTVEVHQHSCHTDACDWVADGVHVWLVLLPKTVPQDLHVQTNMSVGGVGFALRHGDGRRGERHRALCVVFAATMFARLCHMSPNNNHCYLKSAVARASPECPPHEPLGCGSTQPAAG